MEVGRGATSPRDTCRLAGSLRVKSMEEYKGYLSCHMHASELLSWPQTEVGSKQLC